MNDSLNKNIFKCFIYSILKIIIKIINNEGRNFLSLVVLLM